MPAQPKRNSLSGHKLVLALVGAGGIVIGAALTPILTEFYQDRRDTARAKEVATTALSNATREVGSFLENAYFHPERVDALFDAHEVEMSKQLAAVMAANVALGAKDPIAKDRLEEVVKQLTGADACLTKIYRRSPAGPERQRLFDELGTNFMSDTAHIATDYPSIANGAHPKGWRVGC